MSLSILIKQFFLGDITDRVNAIFQQGASLMSAMEDLKREVAESKTVMQSALTLIRGFKDQLAAAQADQASLQQLSQDLDAQANELAAAVAENTPADPNAPTDPNAPPNPDPNQPIPAEPIPEEQQRRR